MLTMLLVRFSGLRETVCPEGIQACIHIDDCGI